MPIPIAAPIAARPIITAAAMYSRSIFRFSMTVSSLFQLKRSSVGKLMFFRRHRQIDDRQNHEDEGLQRNDQDVENGPRHIQDPL
ncbi:Uncharacterised protein [Shigella sonnei]|nr:Uncharacterised protein [Shigella sonnei]